MFFFSFGVSAEEITYQNVITDSTSIEDDFKIIDMDMSNYYLTDIYKDFERAYVVAMSEAYTDDKNIQTYFYVYCPLNKEITIESLTYKLNDKSNTYTNDKGQLDYIKNKGLYKYKGFIYDYVSTAKLEITQIKFKYSTKSDPDSGLVPMAVLPPIGTTIKQITSKSTFKATIKHDLTNNTFTCELNYNSLFIVDEYVPVCVPVSQEDKLINDWNTFWSSKEVKLNVFFYNFNFPKKYKNTDKVFKAVFSFNKMEYKYIYETSNMFFPDYSNLTTKEEKKVFEEQEYDDNTKTLQVNKHSQELTFPTFYLGNRIEDNQFGYFKVAEKDKKNFDYDCSVLLGAEWEKTYINQWNSYQRIVEGTTLKDIEMIELHFRCNGVIYHCQVVSKPTDPILVSPEKSIWQKFCDWFINNFPQSLFICFVGLIGSLLLLWFLIFVVLPLPFKIIKEILK